MAEGSRTPFFMRRQSGGQFALESADITTGSRFYVHSGTGTDALGNGRNPDAPCATIDYAYSLCTASQGDRVYVMPGHAENITAADSIDCDLAGVSIIGLGEGNLLPTISTTAAAGSITVAAANVSIKNVRLTANFATGTTAGITIGAGGDGCTLDGIQFRDTSTANEYVLHISVATTVTDLKILNCDFVCLEGGSATNSILFAGTTSNLVIEGCRFFVDSTDSVVDHLTGAATNCLIKDNILYNADDQTAGYVLDFHASSTGLAIGNRGAYNKNDAEMTKGVAMWWVENYFSNTIAESGLLEPATSHAIP